ncbi:MAG: helical backbone metal receptor [Acidimicrobiales bacterium]
MRVVSLVPSITETLLAWGVRPVAVTRFCEQPGFPTVGGTKNPDVEAIVALAPDLVVVDTEENRLEDHDALVAHGLVVHASSVRSVGDVAPELRRLAGALGLDVHVDDVDTIVPAAVEAGRVFVPIWRRPWMTINADTYGASLLAHVGRRTCFDDAAERYPVVELADVVACAPALALVPTEPYAFTTEHCVELAEALSCPARLVDGKDLFWWGVRTPAALRRLAAEVAA